MKILCTFSGKFGDILWSLPTVREINKLNFDEETKELIGHTGQVDFGIMSQYESLLPLLNAQNYIHKAFVIPNWICTGSPHGDQPWEAPAIAAGVIRVGINKEVRAEIAYDKVYHLTYRNHPSKDQPLITFIAQQQGITLQNPIPFIKSRFSSSTEYVEHTISYSFNESMLDQKERFLNIVKEQLPQVKFVDVSKLPWLEAADAISLSHCFIGCRSSNYVLACGLGKRVFVFEPNIARSRFGMWGTTFTCPYANETEVHNSTTCVEEIKSLVAGVIQ